MSSEMSKIYGALMAARYSNEALASWVTNVDGRDLVRSREREIEEGFAAYNRLSEQLREGRKHIEPPEDYKHTSCYCSAPTCSPPCGWCTDPASSDDEEETPSQEADDSQKYTQPLTHCADARGCYHPQCPQLRDGEPFKTGRHCPLDAHSEEV